MQALTNLKWKWFGAIALALLTCTSVQAQRINLDGKVGAGDLTLFPRVENGSEYYYLPDQVQLARHENGKPKFSFIKYVQNEDAEIGSNTVVESGEAGGIIHAVVSLNVTQEQLRDAQSELRRIDGDGIIMGPLTYRRGKVSLISSVANPDGTMSEQILGMGPAPVLENAEAAVSVQLTRKGADILWATFETPTPDFTFAFEMEVEGYLEPKRATVTAKLDEMYQNQLFEVAAVSPVLSGEIKAAFDKMVEEKTIEVTQIGTDDKMEQILDKVYTKLTNLLFDRVENSNVQQLQNPNNGESMFDRASKALKTAREDALAENKAIDERRKMIIEHNAKVRAQGKSARDARAASKGKTIEPPKGDQKKAKEDADKEEKELEVPENVAVPSYSVALSYSLKRSKKSGIYKVDLNKYTSIIQTIPFVKNVGNIDCDDCFSRVNLDDPLYKQHVVHASIDGLSSGDFGTYVNFVDVALRKTHENGDITVDQIHIDKGRFNKNANDFVMQYGWKGDDNRSEWLNYEYKTLWSFFGGHQVEGEWKQTNFSGITLAPPLIKKPIYLEIDPDFAAEANLRAVEVKLDYHVGEQKQVKRIRMRVSKDELSHTEELVLPKNVDDYCYQITWFIKGKPPVVSEKVMTQYGSIYLDTLPAELN